MAWQTTGSAGTSRRSAYGPTDDPDADGLSNAVEQGLGTHPGRTNVDRDRDGLPDTWELARYRTLAEGPLGLESPGVTNIDAYELGLLPAPPAIAAQPQGQPVVPGQSVVLSVVAHGTAPVSYQW